MKRIISILLVMVLGFLLTACGNGKTNSENVNNLQNSTVKHTGKKITGKITSASVFSDGLAFVCIDGNKEKAYCIDKDGNIIFELDNKISSAMGKISEKFYNGYALVDGGICNTKGEITYPQDVGATEFFGIALEGGYIVATKISADYSSSKNEMGVMNTEFEWVVQPSEDIYEALGEDLWTTTASNTQSFYSNGVVYFDGCEKFLNIKTGEVSENINITLPSDTWIYYTDNTFRNTNEKIMLDLSNLDNIESTGNNLYKNGRVPVVFHNQKAGKRFWAFVDEKGEFLFNPIEMMNFTEFMYSWIKHDGKYVVFYNKSAKLLNSYNTEGELLGELSIEDLSLGYIEDGIILLISGDMNSKECRYYNADFTALF